MRTGAYAGSFDPFTNGHRSVVVQALSVFDRILVVVAENPQKTTLFSSDERVALIERELADLSDRVTVLATQGFVAPFCESRGAQALVRGIRGRADAEFETRLAALNRSIAPNLQTVFVPSDEKLSTVSSSELKRRLQAGEDAATFCGEHVRKAVLRKLAVEVRHVA